MDQVEFSQKVARSDAEKIIEMVEKLEEIDNIKKIVEFAVKK
jgi:DNA-directed RNA polymerase subunit F